MDKLDLNKSQGSDGHHPRTYKELSHIIYKPLHLIFIFMKSLREWEITNDWKYAEVIPVHKKGPCNSPQNYHPISLTSIACKMMESIIREYLMHHMPMNNLFANQKHGFLPCRSCITQLLEVLDNWFQNFYSNICNDVIYLDMAKAFYSAPHKRLLSLLISYGITDNLHKWIESFLFDRKQRTRISSRPAPDRPHVSTTRVVVNMAAKFQPANPSPPFNYTMTDQHGSIHPLDRAEAEKDLVVWIDNWLTFSVHVAKLATKANSLLGLIHRSFKYLDKDSLPLIYKDVIRPTSSMPTQFGGL